MPLPYIISTFSTKTAESFSSYQNLVFGAMPWREKNHTLKIILNLSRARLVGPHTWASRQKSPLSSARHDGDEKRRSVSLSLLSRVYAWFTLLPCSAGSARPPSGNAVRSARRLPVVVRSPTNEQQLSRISSLLAGILAITHRATCYLFFFSFFHDVDRLDFGFINIESMLWSWQIEFFQTSRSVFWKKRIREWRDRVEVGSSKIPPPRENYIGCKCDWITSRETYLNVGRKHICWGKRKILINQIISTRCVERWSVSVVEWCEGNRRKIS